MQKQNIVLIPPSDEQAYACFHVARELAAAFVAYLADRGIEIADPPTRVGRLGPKSQDVIEIEVKDDRFPINELEAAVDDFFAVRKIDNE